jgi:transposase-like protein
MTRKADRELAANLKATVALAALRGDRTLADLAAQFGLDPEQIQEWKHELERNAAAAFQRETAPSEAPTLPISAPLAPPRDRPGLPSAHGQRAAMLQSPGRLKAPTLPPRPAQSSAQPPKVPAARIVQDEATLPQWPSAPKAPTLPQAASDKLDDDYWGEHQTLQTSGVGTSARTATGIRTLPRVQPASPTSSPFFRRFFIGWKEKHHAAATSRELLRVYERVAAARPGLKRKELYRYVVMAHRGGSQSAADAVLARATESFATWPVERALTFRDVVHYLAVSDYLTSGDIPPEWTRENLGRVVASLVPDEL